MIFSQRISTDCMHLPFQVVLHNWLLFEAHMRITRVSFASKNKMNNSNGLEKIIHSWRREEGMRVVQGYTILRNLLWELKKCLKFYDCLLFSRIIISYLLAGGFEFLMGRKASQSAMFSIRFSQQHNSPVYLLFFYA